MSNHNLGRSISREETYLRGGDEGVVESGSEVQGRRRGQAGDDA